MNLKRFTGRTSRDALALVRQSFGPDAVVMSTRPCAEGVEVLAMAPESVQQLEKLSASVPAASPAPAATRAAPRARPPVREEQSVDEDVEQLSMSTLSFQDYVRERMLKRRRVELSQDGASAFGDGSDDALFDTPAPTSAPVVPSRLRPLLNDGAAEPGLPTPRPLQRRLPATPPAAPSAALPTPEAPRAAMSRVAAAAMAPAMPSPRAESPLRQDQVEMMQELRSMRGLIEQRFGALAFMEKLQRQPRQATLTQKLLDAGFSPALIRKLVDGLPADGDETEWAAQILQRNLVTGEQESPLEDQGGVFALIGSTGVGKTTSTAKLAAAFATRHGAGHLGLITLDAYRVAAHEQLRAYGRILGVPVHTAHDRASLEDLLDLLSGKKMVLIDTAGMAQRDERTRELLDMLSHRAVNRLLVVNAASQGETIEDVLTSYRASNCRGVILSKIDEAMKLGPALDAMIRHKVKVLAVANGQRVPEDWHRMSAQGLLQRALRAGGSAAWKLDSNDVNLVFAAQPSVAAAVAHGA